MQEIGHWPDHEHKEFALAMAQLINQMEDEPFTDLLGPVYMEWCGGNVHTGEFYTPQSLALAMAKMAFTPEQVPALRPLTVLEPACGSGVMVLALAKVMVDAGFSPLRMHCQCIDVSKTACDMAFINLTLWGVPAEIVHGNALSLEVWKSWRNPFCGMAQGVDPLATALGSLLELEQQSAVVDDKAVADAAVSAEVPKQAAAQVRIEKGPFVFDMEGLS